LRSFFYYSNASKIDARTLLLASTRGGLSPSDGLSERQPARLRPAKSLTNHDQGFTLHSRSNSGYINLLRFRFYIGTTCICFIVLLRSPMSNNGHILDPRSPDCSSSRNCVAPTGIYPWWIGSLCCCHSRRLLGGIRSRSCMGDHPGRFTHWWCDFRHCFVRILPIIFGE